MAKTLAELKTSILSWLAIDQDSDTEQRLSDVTLTDIINIVSRDYLRRRESQLGEQTFPFSTQLYTPDYAWPVGFSKPRKIWYINALGKITVVGYLDKDKFDVTYPDTSLLAINGSGALLLSGGGQLLLSGGGILLLSSTTQITAGIGEPVNYTLWAGSVVLGPAPDSVLTIFLDYYSLEGLTRFLSEAWEYLLFASLVKATEYGIEDDRVPIWEKEAARFEAALDLEDARQKTVPRRSQSEEPG